MPFWMLIEDFLQDLKTNKTRSLLTSAAVAWGTLAIVLMMAFGRGFRIRIESAMTNAGNNIIRVYGGQTGMKYRGLSEGRWINFTEEDARILRESIPQIRVAAPSYGRSNVRLIAGDRTATTYMEAVYPSFEFLRTMYPKAGGRFLNESDLVNKRRVIYLGADIADELFPRGHAVGSQLKLDGIPFTVVGVMQSKMQMGMSNGPDTERAIIPFTTFELLYPHRYLRMITVQPNRLADTQQVRREIYRVLGRKLRFDPDDREAIQMWDFVTNFKQMSAVFMGIEIFLGIMGGLTLLIAGVGIANIMYVVVTERTREIGIKLAIGARPRHITAQFIFESLLIVCMGGAVGMLISWGVVALMRAIPVGNAGLAYLGKPQISGIVVLITLTVLALIGLVAGVFPARKAARLDPVESLRYE